MSCFPACCCIPEQETVPPTGDVTHDVPNTLTSSMTETRTKPLVLDDLYVDNDFSHNCENDGPIYADILQNPDALRWIEVLRCPVDYDFSEVLSRHRDTITRVNIPYVCDPNDYPNFPGAILRLSSSLKELPHLSFLGIQGDAGSHFPEQFLQDLSEYTRLEGLVLRGTFDFGNMPLQCSSVTYLVIKDMTFVEFDCAVDLSKLNKLAMVSVSAKRKLILPEATSAIGALDVSNITSLEGNLTRLSSLKMTDCPVCVVEQLLTMTNPSSLYRLVIESTDPIELHRVIDARNLDVLGLTNIALESIDTDERTPVQSMTLTNTTITAPVDGMEFHAVRAYVSYNEMRHLDNLRLNSTILKWLVLGRVDHTLREMTSLDIRAMEAVNRFKHNLELFATFAPITEFPEMPRLKYLALYSEAERKLTIGKVPQLVELASPGFVWGNSRCYGVTLAENCFDLYQYWLTQHSRYRPDLVFWRP